MDAQNSDTPQERLSQLSIEEREIPIINMRYSAVVRDLRWILPLTALGMMVVIITWNATGNRLTPMKKEEVLPASENIQNELMKPVFNSVDAKEQPYSVTADRAVQGRDNPDIIELENPVAGLDKKDGGRMDAKANTGLYEQKSQKLNLSGDVHIKSSDGYTLSTQELRLDLDTQKAYSGRDVMVTGPSGTLEAKGLEGDSEGGTMIFTGPAKVILNSTSGPLIPTKENTE